MLKKLELWLESAFVVGYIIETLVYAGLPENERLMSTIIAGICIIALIFVAIWCFKHDGGKWKVAATLNAIEALYIMPFAAYLLSAWLPGNIIFALAGIIVFPGVIGGLAIAWCMYKEQSVIDITMPIALPTFGVFTSIGVMLFLIGCFS